ncbi:MAG TPA: hypothetical protein VFU76_12110, partial [Terriglobales bacterium]|nr:hypothetical protein [Terriglobales bacterium]
MLALRAAARYVCRVAAAITAPGMFVLLWCALGAAQAKPAVVGTIVYSRAGATEGSIWMAAGDGSSDVPIAAGEWPALSPDHHWMAYHGVYASGSSAPQSSIFVRQLPAGADAEVYRYGSDSANYYSFTADSSKLFFDAIADINAVNRDGSGLQAVILNGDGGLDDVPIVRISDGAFAFHNANSGLGLAKADGSNQHFIANTSAGDLWPQWSPDEAWLSFNHAGNLY